MDSPIKALEALIHEYVPKLSLTDPDLPISLLDAGEWVVSFEMLCGWLMEDDIVVDADHLAIFQQLGALWHIAPKYWSQLGREPSERDSPRKAFETLVHEYAPKFSWPSPDELIGLLDAGEVCVSFEMLCDCLAEAGIVVDADHLAIIQELGALWHADSSYWQRFRKEGDPEPDHDSD